MQLYFSFPTSAGTSLLLTLLTASMLESLAYSDWQRCVTVVMFTNSAKWFVFVMGPRCVYSEEEKNIYTPSVT